MMIVEEFWNFFLPALRGMGLAFGVLWVLDAIGRWLRRRSARAREDDRVRANYADLLTSIERRK